MSFSIFKKPDLTKSGIKPATKAGSVMGGAGSPVGKGRSVPAHKPVQPGAPADELDFNEPVGRGHIELQLKDSHDPIESDIEEAAILYANSQDDETREVLENAIKKHRSRSSERLWLMLFDFYYISGLHAEFDTLGLRYAKGFEKSPPIWRGMGIATPEPPAVKPGGLITLPFKGGLEGSNTAAFDAIVARITNGGLLRVDLTRVSAFDAAGCSKLVEILQVAGKRKCQIKLLGRDTLLKKLEQTVSKLPPGQEPEYWLLLLELYQMLGMEEQFEETALNYAISFEVSPPWWDASRIDVNTTEIDRAVETAEEEPLLLEDVVTTGDIDVFPLHDEIKNARFEGLADFANAHSPIIIDFNEVKRIDFVSAGSLINILNPSKRLNKSIIIRNPNYLVAALLNVVGVQSIADIRSTGK